MKNNKINFYKLEDSKTSITFNNLGKRKTHISIIRNSIIISIIYLILFSAFDIYENNKIGKLEARVYTPEIEYTNTYSSNLKSFKKNNKKYEILVNKANPLTLNMLDSYKQVNVYNNLYSNIKIETNTYKNYLKFKKAVESKGYYLNIQNGLIESNTENMISEHNIGLAIDIIVSKDKNTLKSNYKSDEYKYLENISYIYGFIIRYPKGKEKITGYNYKPYHLRYVGKDLAKYLAKNNLTLEEYYEEKE